MEVTSINVLSILKCCDRPIGNLFEFKVFYRPKQEIAVFDDPESLK
jgi:hypothetical protein